MQKTKVRANPSVPSLGISWILMIPLFCFASDGQLWFRSGAFRSATTATFGALTGGKGDTADNIAVAIVVIGIIPILILSRFQAITRLFKKDKLFILLAAWTMASCIWSQLPFISLQWSSIAILNIGLAFYLFLRFTPEQQLRLFLLLGSVCVLLSIFLALALPNYGIDHTVDTNAWRGMYAQKNMCSMVTEFLLIPGLYASVTSLRGKLFRLAYICLSVFLIIMTQSASGKVTLIALFFYYVAMKLLARLRRNERVLLLLGGSLLAAISAAGVLSTFTEIALFLGKDPTLTGRTVIWEAMIPSVMKHPLLGYGYRAFWRGFQGESANVSLASHWAVPSAHNGFLEILITLGLIGVGLVLYSMLRALRDAYTCLTGDSTPYIHWCAGVVFMTLIISVDEGELVNPYGLMWMMYVMACLALAKAAKHVRRGLPGE